MNISFSYYLELFFWTAGFVFLALCDPAGAPIISLCPLHFIGWEYCPGCGLGRSISLLLHGSILESINTHILGIPAAVILCSRIVTIAHTVRQRMYMHRSHI